MSFKNSPASSPEAPLFWVGSAMLLTFKEFKMKQETVEIQESLKKIKSRQLGRLMEQLKAVNTPQIVLDAVEKYWNYFYLDAQQLIQENQEYDKSNK